MLTQEQLAQYRLDGYVLVSGLISEETIANAEAAMWFTLGMNRDDPTSWSPFPEETDGLTTNVNLGLIEHFGLQTPALLACCTPAFCTPVDVYLCNMPHLGKEWQVEYLDALTYLRLIEVRN